MSTGRDGDPTIRAHRNRRAVHAPVAIWEDTNLSVAARMILPYLLSLADRPGWSVRVSHVCAALRISRFTWTAARKSMEACGYYRAIRRRMAPGTQMTDHSGKRRGAAGSWAWEHWVTDVPNEWGDVSPDDGHQPLPPASVSPKNSKLVKKPSPTFPMDGFTNDGFTNDGFTGDGFTSDGKPSDIHDPDLHNIKSRSSKDKKAATTAPLSKSAEPKLPPAINGGARTNGVNDLRPDAPLLSEGADNNVTGKSRPRRRTHPETGLVYWLDDEPAEIERLIAAHGLDAVRTAGSALASTGTDPLPGMVAKKLQANVRAAVQTKADAARPRGRTPEERAEDGRKAVAEMAAMAAQASAAPEPRRTDTRSLETILAETWGIKS